jgi:hypothetical protein
MRLLLLVLLLATVPAHAQVYRWIDSRGTVHYSNNPPPEAAKADKLAINAQGERMEARQARRDVRDAQLTAERVALAPPPVRGLEFRNYISLQRGMTEGEVLAIAGPPDMRSRDRSFDRLTYMPTVADPFVTTITLMRGRISEMERARKF